MEAAPDELALLFEGAPQFIARLQAVTAADESALLDAAREIALTMPEAEQIELLNAHPRIGAAPASVSALSYREQGYDRDPGTEELQARLDGLNIAYEERNGFRFVIFVNGRSRAEIADIMEGLLGAPRDQEKRRALEDVILIARSRLARIREVQPA
jgi:2-oxo-4-hydroxy-4-carboxy--5-ureidoimidazoline (OHCU) decarboxylase